MKHKPVIIRADDLYNRIFSDSDWCELSDIVDIEDPWYVVSWPEHVTNLKYNGDASYVGYSSLVDAQSDYPDSHIYDWSQLNN